MTMLAFSSSPLHAALRRHLVITRRLPRSQNRSQSSSSAPSKTPDTTTSTGTTKPNTSTTTTTTTTITATKPTDPNIAILPNTTVPVAPPPPPPTPAAAKLSIWQRLGPLTRAGEAYARTQRRRPYLTQTAATLVIYFLGDLCAQYIGREEPAEATETAITTTTAAANTTDDNNSNNKNDDDDNKAESETAPSFLATQYSPTRTLRSMAIGGLAAIPGWHWFLFLSNNFNFASSRPLSILAKVAINQVVFTPCFNTYFFGAQSLLSGSTMQEAWERIKLAVPTSMINSVKLWPAVTAFSFAFVPIEFRSIFAGGVAIGWQTYLSFLNKEAEAVARANAIAGADAGAGAGAGAASATTTTTTTTTTVMIPTKKKTPSTPSPIVAQQVHEVEEGEDEEISVHTPPPWSSMLQKIGLA